MKRTRQYAVIKSTRYNHRLDLREGNEEWLGKRVRFSGVQNKGFSTLRQSLEELSAPHDEQYDEQRALAFDEPDDCEVEAIALCVIRSSS